MGRCEGGPQGAFMLHRPALKGGGTVIAVETIIPAVEIRQDSLTDCGKRRKGVRHMEPSHRDMKNDPFKEPKLPQQHLAVCNVEPKGKLD